MKRICNQIAKADIIIADMTGRNPHLFYEVGYAHALGKRVFLLVKNAADMTFDRKHVIYGDRIQELKETLNNEIRWSIEGSDQVARAATADIEPSIEGQYPSQETTKTPNEPRKQKRRSDHFEVH